MAKPPAPAETASGHTPDCAQLAADSDCNSAVTKVGNEAALKQRAQREQHGERSAVSPPQQRA